MKASISNARLPRGSRGSPAAKLVVNQEGDHDAEWDAAWLGILRKHEEPDQDDEGHSQRQVQCRLATPPHQPRNRQPGGVRGIFRCAGQESMEMIAQAAADGASLRCVPNVGQVGIIVGRQGVGDECRPDRDPYLPPAADMGANQHGKPKEPDPAAK